jgi:hypothetical protein
VLATTGNTAKDYCLARVAGLARVADLARTRPELVIVDLGCSDDKIPANWHIVLSVRTQIESDYTDFSLDEGQRAHNAPKGTGATQFSR